MLCDGTGACAPQVVHVRSKLEGQGHVMGRSITACPSLWCLALSFVLLYPSVATYTPTLDRALDVTHGQVTLWRTPWLPDANSRSARLLLETHSASSHRVVRPTAAAATALMLVLLPSFRPPQGGGGGWPVS